MALPYWPAPPSTHLPIHRHRFSPPIQIGFLNLSPLQNPEGTCQNKRVVAEGEQLMSNNNGNVIQVVYEWYRSTIRNPKYRWWLVAGTLLYILSPIDIAPDFIPIIGQIDDVVLITLLVSEVSQLLIDRVKTTQQKDTAEAVKDAQTNTSNASVDVNAVQID